MARTLVRASLPLAASLLVVGAYAALTARHDAPRLLPELTQRFPALATQLAGGSGFARQQDHSWSAGTAALGMRLPERYIDATIIEHDGIRITSTPVAARAATSAPDGASLTYRSAYHDTDVVYASHGQGTEEFLYLRDPSAPTTFAYHLSFAHGVHARVVGDEVRFADASGDHLGIAAPTVIDALGRHGASARWTLAARDGSAELALTIDAHGAPYPLLVDPSWIGVGTLVSARGYFTIAPTPSGAIAIGGFDGSSVVSSCELYNDTTHAWATASFATVTTHAGVNAIPLADGRVLIAGGYDTPNSVSGSMETLDAAVTGFTACTAVLSTPRTQYAAGVLGDAHHSVLMAGGVDDSQNNLASAELYDPVLDSMASAGSMQTARSQAGVAVLPGNQLLVAGGQGGTHHNGFALASCEIYDLGSGTWATTAASMRTARSQFTLVPLSATTFLAVGGQGNGSNGNNALASCEIYDATLNSWTPTGSMHVGRVGCAVVALGTNILAAGGGDGSSGSLGNALFSCEIYDVSTGQWSMAPNLPGATGAAASCLLGTGTALVAGGQTGDNTVTNLSAEYNSSATDTAPTLSPQSLIVNAGQIATITFPGADADQNALGYTITTTPAHGSLSEITGNQVLYQPDAGYGGADSFAVVASDGVLSSSASVVSITVHPVPVLTIGSNPTCAISGSVTLGTSNLQAIDAADTASQLVFTLDQGPFFGSLVVNGTALSTGTGTFTEADLEAGHVVYQAGATFATEDGFEVHVSDGIGVPAYSTPGQGMGVHLSGTRATATGTPSISTTASTITPNVAFPLQGALSGQEPGFPATDLTFTVSSAPANGTLWFGPFPLQGGTVQFSAADVAAGRITYQANVSGGRYAASDAFAVTLTDGSTTTSAQTVTLTSAGGTYLVTNAVLHAQLNNGTTLTAANLLANGIPNVSSTNVVYSIVSAPQGQLQLNGGQLNSGDTFTQNDINNQNVMYNSNGASTDSFTFTVQATGASSAGPFTFAIANQAAPALSGSRNGVVQHGGSMTVTSAMLQLSSTTVTDAGLTYTLQNTPFLGELRLSSTPLHQNDTFTQQDVDRGNVIYVQNNGDGEYDSFDLTYSDGATSGNNSIQCEVLINHPPQLLTDQTIQVNPSGGVATVTSHNLLAVDIEQAAPQITYTLTTAPATGTLKDSGTSVGLNGTFTQDDIDTGLVTYTATGAGSSDSFAFTISDGAGGSASGSASVSFISGPVITADAGILVQRNGSVTLAASNLSGTSTAGSGLTYTLQSQPNKGHLSDHGSALSSTPGSNTFTQSDINSGWISYAQDGGDGNDDQFTVTLSDGVSTTPAVAVAISINHPPVIAANGPLTMTSQQGNRLQLGSSVLLATDEEQTAEQLIYTLSSVPSQGTLVDFTGATLFPGSTFTQAELNAGWISYQSPQDTSPSGSDSFSYTVADGVGGTTALTTFTVTFATGIAITADGPLLVQTTSGSPVTSNLFSTLLNAQDSQGNTSDITWTVTSAPVHGTLEVGGSPGSSFTMSQVFNGQVAYATSFYGSATDSIVFSVSDTSGDPTLTNVSFAIQLVPVPQVTLTPIVVQRGGSYHILSSISVVDNNAAPVQQVFTITQTPTLGSLELDGFPLAVGQSFTMDDVHSDHLVYVETAGSGNNDNIQMTFTDGITTLGNQNLQVQVDAPPVVTADTGVTVPPSVVTTITGSMLAAHSTAVADSTLVFQVSAPGSGTLSDNGSTVTQFSQQDLDNGLVTYTAATSTFFTFTVSDGQGGSSTPQNFSITVSQPSVISAAPAFGPLAGGNTVTINGSGFLGATSVTFGGNGATGIIVGSNTSLTCSAPAGASGSVDVVVTGPSGSGTGHNAYTYEPAPTITGLSFVAGPLAGGQILTITGTNFNGFTSVTFGGTSCPTVGLVDASHLQVTTPAQSAGTIDVTVVTGGGSATATGAYTYEGSPTITGVSPSAGPQVGDQTATITGTNLVGASVQFGGVAATNVVVAAGGASLTCMTPAQAPGAVTVSVTTPVNTATQPGGYTYVATPVITAVSPISGPLAGGQTVTLTGSSFTGTTLVLFGSATASSVVVNSDTQLTCVTPADSEGLVDVSLTSTGGTVVDPQAYAYQNVPAVTGVSPASGPSTGGTTITVTGTDFLGATGVTVNGVAATSVSVSNQTTLTCVTPAGSIGAVDVLVTTPSGTSATAAADQFTYQGPPTIASLAPTAGPQSGGQSVTITGTNLLGTQGVTFGGVAATGIVVNSATQVTCTTPAGAPGAVDVALATPSGTSNTLTGAYTYIAAPTVTAVAPIGGPLAGGTSVTITGTNLTGATSVLFGTQPATGVTVVNATSITCTAPASGVAGTVHVTVTTLGGTSGTSASDLFDYQLIPAVSSVTPAFGPIAGGVSVTITGTDLENATSVMFGSNAATNVTVVNPGSITCTVPAGGSAGGVNVLVTTPGGTSPTGTNAYTYQAAPTVTGIAPSVGPTAGGQTVTITGTGFSNVTGVSFGSTAATSVSVVSPTSIQCTSPAETASVVDITVTTAGGTSSVIGTDQYTFQAPPIVSAVSPTVGPTAGGQTVTISGVGFSSVLGVSFGGIAATGFTVVGPTSITCTTPSVGAGTVDVTVSTPGGVSATGAADQYTFQAPPTVTAIAPSAGLLAGGQTVTITGTGFTNVTGVAFGGTAATGITVVSATSLTCTSPAGSAGTVDVTVTTAGGTSATGAADRYAYQPAPTVTAVAPAIGPAVGGQSVTITGTDFTNASGVSFGGTAATAFTVVSATSITCTSPPASAGTVDVTVTTPGGTSATAAADQYTFQAAPTVTAVAPAIGPAAGGQTVTITGTGFTHVSGVSFGGTASTSVSTVSATSITCTSPAGSTGTVDITVITAGGTSATSSADHYTYQAAPTVTAIVPAIGPTAGGQTVTITGTVFTNVTGVSFGATAATNVTVVSPTSITCTSPAEAPGTVDVTVSTAGGTSATSSADQYTYQAAPTVTAITPSAGPLGGGVPVTITGTNLSNASGVSFGGTAATSVSVVSVTRITCVAPAASVGTVDVTVTTPGGTSATSSADQFLYQAVPTVTAVSPAAGPLAGGQSVTITGTNFANVTGVLFGGNPATGVTVVSATSITCTSPSGSAGTVDVAVTTPGGTSGISSADHYGYQAAPTVTAVSPAVGPTAGGQNVTITGTGYTNVTGVSFGGTAATGVTVVSATSITCTSPAAAAGTVDVTVTTAGGTSATGSSDHYAFQVAPTVTAVSPGLGPAGGGQSVTITGTGFANVSGVSFGGTAATGITVVSATTITCTSPAAAAGTLDVTVTTAGGTSATGSPDQYTFQAAPSVTAVTPAAGPVAGGQSVTITGTGFTNVTGVTFGGTPATGVTTVSPTSITCTSPAGTTGAVDVAVATAGGTGSLASGYAYEGTPTITGVTPSSGPLPGGQVITITGTNLAGATSVTVGGAAATGITATSLSSLTCTTPAGAAGLADVEVTTPLGGVTATGSYLYVPAPTITAIAPTSGPTAGGTVITISGTNLTGTTGVTVGGTAATAVTVVSATSVTCMVPAGSAGAATVTLTTPGGTATDAGAYTYVAPAGSGGSSTAGGTGGGASSSGGGCGLGGGMGMIALLMLAMAGRRHARRRDAVG